MEFRQVKPPDLKETSLNKLAAYIVAQFRVCKHRSSICPYRYEEVDELQLDLDEDMDDHDWSPSGLACRTRTKLSEYRAACKTLFDILHRDDLLRNPYLTWPNKDLITSLNQRAIALPRHRVKSSYALALKQADETRVFELMDLPQEIRSMVYESALLLGTEPDHSCNPNVEPAAKPALLQTCRQVRQEGTAIFFRINRFLLHSHLFRPNDLYPRTESWLRDYLSADHLSNLSYVTLASQCCRNCPSYHINIDLCCRDPLKWTIRKRQSSSHLLSCEDQPDPPAITFLQERRGVVVAKSPQSAQKVVKNIATAKEALGKLWKTCGQGGKMRPSNAGLLELMTDVHKVNMNFMVDS
ncbi:unnamed protein product [Aureobasidium uvarum]|uniref:Uncharacterized protein n=1 Tax=Aureobasidium uvarum TaxID=2773716 RepID=A0A9N8KDF6_9PEZI|nr:unnamed protein product [Aureobasidium uvarum]